MLISLSFIGEDENLKRSKRSIRQIWTQIYIIALNVNEQKFPIKRQSFEIGLNQKARVDCVYVYEWQLTLLSSSQYSSNSTKIYSMYTMCWAFE